MNENGYVIYPDGLGYSDLNEALEVAKMCSYDEERRVEDCDTEKVIARFLDGKEV